MLLHQDQTHVTQYDRTAASDAHLSASADLRLVTPAETLCVSMGEYSQVSNSKCLKLFDRNLISGEEIARSAKPRLKDRI